MSVAAQEAMGEGKVATPSTPPNRSTYYSPQSVQQWQAVHGAGTFPPNYRPSGPPVGKPEMPTDVIYKGESQQKQVQQDPLYQQRLAQQEKAIQVQQQEERIREANIQQSEYRQAVQSRQFKQSEISKEAPVLPKQRTASSLDEATKEYNNLISEPVAEPKPKTEPKQVIGLVKPVKTTEPKPKVIEFTKPKTEPKGSPNDLRLQLAEKQGEVKPSGGGGEAVSFLRFPFTKNKGADSNNIRSTTILDPLQFFIGGAVTLAAKGGSVIAGLIKGEAKTIVKGTADIGLSLGSKTEKKINTEKARDALSDFNRIVESSKGKGPTVYQTPQSKEFLKPTTETKPMSEDKISLGLGIGKSVSKEGGKGAGQQVPKPPGPPTGTKPSPGTKEITSKTGLVQLLKEKNESDLTKLVQSQKTETVKLGTGTTKIVKTEKPKPISATEQVLKSVQKKKTKQEEQTPLLLTKPPEAKTQQERITGLIETPKTESTQKQRDFTGLVSKQTQSEGTGQPDLTGLIPVQTPKQTTKQTTVPTEPEPIFTGLIIPNPPPGKPPTPPTRTPTPPPKQPGKPSEKPEGLEGLVRDDSKRYDKILKGKSKKKQEFIGNAPIDQIVGTYKRQDIIYGKQVSKLTAEDLARRSSREAKFTKDKSTTLLKKNQNSFTVPPSKKRKIRI